MSITGTFQSLLIGGAAPAPTYTTVLLIHGDGNTLDSSPAARSLIPTHSATFTTALSKFGSGCIDLTQAPNSNFSRIATQTLSAYSPAALDWQVELFIRPTTAMLSAVAFPSAAFRFLWACWDPATSTPAADCYIKGHPTDPALFQIVATVAGRAPLSSPYYAWTAGTWHHVAMAVEGNDLSLFVDGARADYVTVGSKVTIVSPVRWDAGGWDTAISGRSCESYIDDFRLIFGGVTYSGSTYTVPTAALPNSP